VNFGIQRLGLSLIAL